MSRQLKKRSLRPMVESCEARLLMSADATMKIPGTVSALVAASTSRPSAGTFEPLAFQATYVDQNGIHDSLDGTLQLQANEKTGRLTGELADDVQGSIAVQGQIRGGTLNLTFNLGDGTKLSGSGPVIQDHLHSGFWTLESVGSVGIVGQATSGLWKIRGAHAVTTSQPSTTSQAKKIPAGTSLTPTAFTIRIVQGPDAGQQRTTDRETGHHESRRHPGDGQVVPGSNSTPVQPGFGRPTVGDRKLHGGRTRAAAGGRPGVGAEVRQPRQLVG
jgi:hypothetical protein